MVRGNNSLLQRFPTQVVLRSISYLCSFRHFVRRDVHVSLTSCPLLRKCYAHCGVQVCCLRKLV